MKRDWINLAIKCASSEATYWQSGKKVLRTQRFSFADPQGPLSLDDIGYTKSKMGLLKKGYIHEDSLSSAVEQWNNRRNYREKSHWSVGFSCYNHILKPHSNMDNEDQMGSIMGPCLQAVTISHTPGGVALVDVFYRTTEIFKKFPADLVLIRDHMLSRFDFTRTELGSITFHVANLTVSPTYFPTVLAQMPDPIATMEQVREGDEIFHRIASKWVVKLLDGPTQKFNQARRTQNAVKSLMADDLQQDLIEYARPFIVTRTKK